MSWYRTYRPQTVAALHIGSVRDAFTRILHSGEYSHAYLLTGPKGTGKTSGARILAKVLNCEKNRSIVHTVLSKNSKSTSLSDGLKAQCLHEPCNVCATCIAITHGSSLCVREMDAASNRGIDDIRELTARIGLSAGDGPISVIIIDEVHMLTTEAFNALLKVLEEPPAHVVFILATTDAQKLPPTVVSRCQIIQYRKATKEEIVTALAAIATAEKMTVGVGVLDRIVTYADGSFRDGVKAFEQVAKGKTVIEIADVTAVLGASVTEIAEQLVQRLAKREYHEIVSIFEHLDQDGSDILIVQKEVLRSLHARMLAAPAAKNPHFQSYVALVKSLNVPASPSLPYPGLPFEIACLEWCLSGSTVAPAVPPAKIPPTRTPPMQSEPIVVSAPVSEVSGVQVPFAAVLEQWHVVLGRVREKNGSLEALLKTTKPLGVENNILKLEVFYQFHKDQLMLDRNLLMIEEVLAHTFAAHMRLEFVLGKRAEVTASSQKSNLSGIVDLSFVKAAEDALL